jgi:hypothetical protein
MKIYKQKDKIIKILLLRKIIIIYKQINLTILPIKNNLISFLINLNMNKHKNKNKILII